MNTYVVIMAKDIGSRFWQLSTPEYPKQFVDIIGCGRSLIPFTVDRFQGFCSMENFWVMTNAKYVEIIKAQLPDTPEAHMLARPTARNTAPCIAWTCWKIKAENPDANVVVTPSDAVVMNPEEFRRVIGNALAFTAKNDAIVTIVIKPNPSADIQRIISTGDVEGILPTCEKNFINYAVMELISKDEKVFIHPADFGWSNLSNWQSLHETLQKDEANN